MNLHLDIEFISDKFLYSVLSPKAQPQPVCIRLWLPDDIAGMNASQLANRLTIPSSRTFTVIEFPTPSSGLASPILRDNPGFVEFGRSAGGNREFVIPNGPIPIASMPIKVTATISTATSSPTQQAAAEVLSSTAIRSRKFRYQYVTKS